METELKSVGLFDQTPKDVWSRDWIVHCKAVGDGRATMKYIGAYVFRVALSDARVVRYTGSSVRFKFHRLRYVQQTGDINVTVHVD